jgi:FPC/CPF motif-containing protein YcgG
MPVWLGFLQKRCRSTSRVIASGLPVIYTLPSYRGCPAPFLRPLTAEVWFEEAVQGLLKLLSPQHRFPCFFATSAAEAGALFFAEFSFKNPIALISTLREYVGFQRDMKCRSALIVYWESTGQSLAANESEFWRILSLIASASEAHQGRIIRGEHCSLTFSGERLFVNGHSPHYEHRLSRRSLLHPMFVIQTYGNLFPLASPTGTDPAVAHHIRTLVDQFDGIARSPYLEDWAEDWRQFWLLDHNGVDLRCCPIKDEEGEG